MNYRIRPCTLDDAAIIARHRVEMFREMGEVPTEKLAQILFEASTIALRAELDESRYVGWFAVDENDRVVAGACAHIRVQLPRMASDWNSVSSADVPLVVNVYTEHEWRRRGVAKALMQTLMRWAESQGFDRVVLHASDAGRHLYEALGFRQTNEMQWNPRG